MTPEPVHNVQAHRAALAEKQGEGTVLRHKLVTAVDPSQRWLLDARATVLALAADCLSRHGEAARLRGLLGAKLAAMVRLNKALMDYPATFQAIPDQAS